MDVHSVISASAISQKPGRGWDDGLHSHRQRLSLNTQRMEFLLLQDGACMFNALEAGCPVQVIVEESAHLMKVDVGGQGQDEKPGCG